MIVRSRGAQLEVARIQSEINRLFETLIRLRQRGEPMGPWSPGVDIAENETHLVVDVEVAGVDPASLELAAESGNLVVRGIREPSDLALLPGAEVVHDEREYGPFERIVPLPVAVNTHKARARVAAGVLRVELPKVPNRRGEPVPIAIERG